MTQVHQYWDTISVRTSNSILTHWSVTLLSVTGSRGIPTLHAWNILGEWGTAHGVSAASLLIFILILTEVHNETYRHANLSREHLGTLLLQHLFYLHVNPSFIYSSAWPYFLCHFLNFHPHFLFFEVEVLRWPALAYLRAVTYTCTSLSERAGIGGFLLSIILHALNRRESYGCCTEEAYITMLSCVWSNGHHLRQYKPVPLLAPSSNPPMLTWVLSFLSAYQSLCPSVYLSSLSYPQVVENWSKLK